MDQLDEETKNALIDSNWINYFEESNYDILKEKVYSFDPWEYKVLVVK